MTALRVAMVTIALSTCLAMPAVAHEFWLEPRTYRPAPGQPVPISIRIGQKFKGDSFPFVTAEFKQFALLEAGKVLPVRGVDGDDPAVTLRFKTEGLAAIIHYSTPEKLVFEIWDKFAAYLDLEGLNAMADRHVARGLPRANIREVYSRCAKLLVVVAGAAEGQDRLSGLMPLELVVESQPVTWQPGAEMVLRLYLQGQPLADTQITAISRAQSERRMAVRTDADGRARIRIDDAGPWLFNAVHMMEPAEQADADWESLWASLTLAIVP